MADFDRVAVRARRDEARTVNATEPLRCRAALIRVIDDADALDAALESVEQERDALKRENERLRIKANYYSEEPDEAPLVSAEEGTEL